MANPVDPVQQAIALLPFEVVQTLGQVIQLLLVLLLVLVLVWLVKKTVLRKKSFQPGDWERVDGELIGALLILDDLVKKLPENQYQDFYRSPDFKVYEDCMNRYTIWQKRRL